MAKAKDKHAIYDKDIKKRLDKAKGATPPIAPVDRAYVYRDNGWQTIWQDKAMAERTARDVARGTAAKSTMRTFLLVRDADVFGTSGTGVIAEGVEWSHGGVTIHWLSQLESVEQVANVKVLMQVYGHGGKTRMEWTS